MVCCGSRKKYSVLLLGSPGAGKTTLVKQMRRENDESKPTIGLSRHPISIHGYNVIFYDTAGVQDFSDRWSLHLGEAEGFIFALDSTDRRQCQAVYQQLVKTLEHKEVAEKPILIVGTKMDMDGALNEDSLFNVYDLDTILSENRNAQFSFSGLPINASANARSSTKTKKPIPAILGRGGRKFARVPQRLPPKFYGVGESNCSSPRTPNYPESRKQLPDIEEENVEIANDNDGHFKQDRVIGNNSNYHNNNDKNENRGAKSLDEKKLNEIVDQLLIDEGLRATETYDSEVFLSSPEKYGAVARQREEPETMSFKRGTLWLMEAIEMDRKEIDRRISRYMKVNRSKVRKSLKGWTKKQKKWEKSLQKSAARKLPRIVETDEEDTNSEQLNRASISASDSAEKMRYIMDQNINSRFRSDDIRSKASHRIRIGETVTSKRGISFRDDFL